MLDTLTMPTPVKIGGAEFPIRLVANEDIKHTDQDGVGDRDNRALLPSACGQPAEERRQIGLLGMCGTVGQLHQPRPQRTVPLAGFPERRFPALSSLPGATPAHAASRAAVPKRLRSVPISATIISAPRRSTPGLVSNSVIAWSKVKGAAASTCGARPTAGSSVATGTATVSGGVSALSRSAMVVLSVAICSSKKSIWASCIARSC